MGVMVLHGHVPDPGHLQRQQRRAVAGVQVVGHDGRGDAMEALTGAERVEVGVQHRRMAEVTEVL